MGQLVGSVVDPIRVGDVELYAGHAEPPDAEDLMTQMQCLAVLCELAALERLAAVLARPDQPSAPEWQYVRPLIDHRLHWLRVSLSQVDPLLIQSCEHLRNRRASRSRERSRLNTPPLYSTQHRGSSSILNHPRAER